GRRTGISINGISLNAGVSPTGNFTGGVSAGVAKTPISFGPSGTYGSNGFSGGVGANASIGIPGLGGVTGGGWRPALNLGGGISGGDLYGNVGLGLAPRSPKAAA